MARPCTGIVGASNAQCQFTTAEELTAAIQKAYQQNPSTDPPATIQVGGVTYTVTYPPLSVEVNVPADGEDAGFGLELLFQQASGYQEQLLSLLAQSSSLQYGPHPLFTPQEQLVDVEGASAMVSKIAVSEAASALPPVLSFMEIWGLVDAYHRDPAPFSTGCFIIEINEPEDGSQYHGAQYHFLCQAPGESTAASIRPVQVTSDGWLLERSPLPMDPLNNFILQRLWNTFGWC